MAIRVIDTKGLRRIENQGVIGDDGHVKVLPLSFWRGYKYVEIQAFCVRTGIYNVPTAEQVLALQELFGGLSVVEIGAGNGVLARTLRDSGTNIKAVDNHMQADPTIAAFYAVSRQGTVNYGVDVIKADAVDYVSQVRPNVVLGCWITHRYNPAQHHLGGNMHGPDEAALLRYTGTYVHVGNAQVHQNKPLHQLTHRRYEPPWLVSRAFEPDLNEVRIWGRPLPGEGAWQKWRKGLTGFYAQAKPIKKEDAE